MKNYLIMSADTITAEWKDGELTVLNDRLLPAYLKRVPDPDSWLATRAIDSHRANSRLLKKALRLAERDDISTVMYAHGATITDNYWIKSPDEQLSYEDVRFDNSYFARLALTGSYDSFNRAASGRYTKTPELTNTGSFEKCWRLIDGRWYMYKKASHDELFSELFVCRLGCALGMNMAWYERGRGYIKTPDFTEGASVNFEPALTFMGDNEDYGDVVTALSDLCPDAVCDYIRMIYLDTLTLNPDRHTGNFGLLRDTGSGEFTGLAPNFDNNMALISRGYPSMPGRSDILIRLFCELIKAYPQYKGIMPPVSRRQVEGCIEDIGMRVKGRYIADLIMKRYELIMEQLP